MRTRWLLLLVVSLLCTRASAHGSEHDSANASWLANAEQQIAAREYRASENGAGLQAPNRAHDLRTYFDKRGITVRDRTARPTPALLRLSLRAVGRRRDPRKVGPGQAVRPDPSTGGVQIRRPDLVEWYVNSPAGLEQGFTVEKRPKGDGPLIVELAVAHARSSLRGDAVAFQTGTRTLSYGALTAADDAGVPLRARFELPAPDRIRIVVDDSAATYPVVIDPLLTRTADAQLEANQASAFFGVTAAGAGDVNGDGYADVIVGATGYDAGQTDEGAAFVFLGSASGIANGNPATAAAQLEGNQASAFFSSSIAGAGDVNGDGYADVIVGARSYDDGETDEGAAFVFLGSASGVANGNPATAAAVLEADQGNTQFGGDVAGAGDVNGDGYADVIVNAPQYSAGQSAEGAAFVFLGSASGIASGNPASASAQLESNQANAYFAGTVAGAGDVNGDGYDDVIVSAPFYNYGGPGLDLGKAFVFLGSVSGIASGNPGTAATVLASGWSVAAAGDVNGDGYADVVVGVPTYSGGQTDEGAAFVYRGSASGINPAPAAQLESNQANAFFGGSVAGPGDVNGDGYADVIVGSALVSAGPYHGAYDAGQTDEGAAFVFLGSATGIANGNPTTSAEQVESNQVSAFFGSRVAGAGDVNGDGYADVIVGAPEYDAGQTDEGAAFVFLGGASGIASGNPATAAAQLESDQDSAFLGFSVNGAGDVNGDGYADVIVGAPTYDAGEENEGAAFVFLGSVSGIANGDPGTAATQLESNQADAQFGSGVAGAGDVNGDGYADVIVGAQYYDAGDVDGGAAFVFLGSASGIANGNPLTAAARLSSNQLNAYLGSRVAGAGDVNGDGYADVIVGAGYYDAGQTDEGAAFVFLGSSTGIADANPATPGVAQLESNQAGANLGVSVASAGDVNGDGYADVIVSAQSYDAGQTDEGAAFVFLGSSTGIASGNPATPGVGRLESNQTSAYLGDSVAGAGDVNGDGYADVIVGASNYSAGQAFEGAAFVFLGSSSGIANSNPATPGVAQFESNQPNGLIGTSVAGAGDVNGDGYADVIVGAYEYDAGEGPLEGAAWVLLGSASGIANGNPATAAAQLESNQANASFGVSVASAGDVNGDGYADVIVGAYTYDAAETDEGAAFVFLGNAKGRPVLARQRRGNGSGIAVQPWGLAQSTSAFVAELRASHPQGAGRVKVRLEACPSGVPFGNLGCTALLTPTWIAVNGSTPEVLLSQTFTGLSNHLLYRWRARILHAPKTGTIPANPAHGPWRRVGAQAVEADIRLPEPGLLMSLACGAALVAALRRRALH